jgi:hypothetical protein
LTVISNQYYKKISIGERREGQMKRVRERAVRETSNFEFIIDESKKKIED